MKRSKFAYPQTAFAILGQSRGRVEGAAAGADYTTKDAVLITRKTAIAAADPNGSEMILDDRIDVFAKQSFLRRIESDCLSGEPIEAAIVGADPEISFAILIDRSH